MILQFFTFQKDRDKIIDYGNYYPSQNLISILSTPTFRPENVLKIFFTFSYTIWILIFLSFISYSLINALIINDNIKRLSTFIDYFGLLAGQGIWINIFNNHFILWILIKFLIIYSVVLFDSKSFAYFDIDLVNNNFYLKTFIHEWYTGLIIGKTWNWYRFVWATHSND